jgi:hypothetical protein
MKYFLLSLLLGFLTISYSHAQGGKTVTGSVTDSAKVTLPGSSVQIKSDLGDSSITTTDMNGKFTFQSIKGSKITLYISSLGFRQIAKHYTLTANNVNVLPPIILKAEANELKTVNIVGVNPVKFTEDTVDYKVAAYKVRENAPVEDVLKKVPGIDVDANGNVTAQGQSITKVRINGKDFMGGDVQSATKNLPADILESIQVIDDYGDQANLTGVKTGTPNKILNFTIRADKNYGYSLTATAGGGEDMLPSGQTDDARYLGLVNGFDFKGDRQITLLGNLNNTNVNTFNFTGGQGGGGGFNGGQGGGGGGRGNALRGNNNTGLATTQNGITNARSIGTNYRDNWSKTVSVYGSYSFSDNTTYTNSTTLQTNNFSTPSTSSSQSQEHDNPINHRFTFNIEWKPDTVNYLKVTPTFSYAGTNTTDAEMVTSTRSNVINQAYTSTSIDNSQTPTFGLIALYNHHFKNRNNFSAQVSASTSQGSAYDNPIYNYTAGVPTAPRYQAINTSNTTTSITTNLSYLQHLGKVSYLEFNYANGYSYIANDKETDSLSTANTFNNVTSLSNNFKYTFLTNKFGINYRVIEKKYNYTIGLGVQPSVLDGTSITTGTSTHVDQVNVIPAARYTYTVSRSQSFSFNYSGNTTQPTFSQLQPVVDFSNALYPVQGNPNLQPSFSNNVQIRYNNFGIATGNIFFLNGTLTQTDNQVVASTITYPSKFTSAVLAAHPELKALQNTNLTQYLNTSGYYQAQGQILFAKPWDERRYTFTLRGNVNYVNNIGYSKSVTSNDIDSASVKNIAKTLTFTPGTSFRVDITDVIDAQAITSYSIAKTNNSINDPLYNSNTNIRTWNMEFVGKQYILKDWTFSYDYTKQINYGYATSEKVTNPNILNLYLERRFLKQNRATIRFSVFDAFNQNSGFSTVTNGSIVTQSNVNRLGRYYLATFTLRLQKFAGKAPVNPDRGGPRMPGGGRGGFGGGPGGPQ